MSRHTMKKILTVGLCAILTGSIFGSRIVFVHAEDSSETTEEYPDTSKEHFDNNGRLNSDEYITKPKSKKKSKAKIRKAAKNQSIPTSGTTGDDDALKWNFSNGVLTISGDGYMRNFNNPDGYGDEDLSWLPGELSTDKPEWYDLRDQINSIVVEEGVKDIGQYSFYKCNASSVTLPSTAKIVYSRAFAQMPNLHSLTVPEGCEELYGANFEGTPLESLTIPASLNKMYMYNFHSYDDKQPLTMDMIHIKGDNPNMIIEDNILYGDHGKTVLYVDGEKTGHLNVKNGVTKIDYGAFFLSNLSSVTFPSTLGKFDDYCFRGAGLIEELNIPDNVTELGTGCFSAMKNLKKVTIGSGLSSLENDAFEDDISLEDVIIKNGVQFIDEGAFRNCSALQHIEFPDSLTVIGYASFYKCSSLSSITLPENLTSIGDGAFYKTGLKEVTLPRSVVNLYEKSFPKDCIIHYADYTQEAKLARTTDVTYEVNYKETDARSMLDQLNSFRTGSDAWCYNPDGSKTDADASALVLDAGLQKAAMQRAVQIAILYGHITPEGADPSTVLPDNNDGYGENIAVGYKTAEAVMDSWKESSATNFDGQGHRRNMLHPHWNAVGIGHVVVNGVDYWVQEFARVNNINQNLPVADDSVHTETCTVANSLVKDVSFSSSPKSIHLKSTSDTAAIPDVYTAVLNLSGNDDTNTYHTYDQKVPVHPVIKNWWTEDASVATVKDGKIQGLKNGKTNLIGYAFQKKISIPVQVGEEAPTPKPTPSSKPSPTPSPSTKPATPTPTVKPTPSSRPTPTPTIKPTKSPTPRPTVKPTPSVKPSPTPTAKPTPSPSTKPATPTPTVKPTPSSKPSPTPTAKPSNPAPAEKTVTMYRAYNPNSGEHFYTANRSEFNHIVSVGWKNEGVGWIAPEKSNTPVYRLYNKNGGEHHYTTSATEKTNLMKAGWSDEGIGWYSDDSKRTPLYRQYNPNAFANNHNYSTSKSENDYLVSLGWKAEGIGWYGVRAK